MANFAANGIPNGIHIPFNHLVDTITFFNYPAAAIHVQQISADGDLRISTPSGFFYMDNVLGDGALLTSLNSINFKFADGSIFKYGTAASEAIYGSYGHDQLHGGAGNDMINGGAGSDRVYGGSGNDHLVGGTGKDTLFGEDGDDVLDGSGDIDADNLAGGSGNDTYYVSEGDTIVEDASTAVGGVDTVYVRAASADMATGVENAILDQGALSVVGNELNNTITGNDLNNTINGGLGDDVLVGGAGVDVLYGEAGNDFLDGGEGDDQMVGGVGDDTYVYTYGDTIVESFNPEGGVDTILTSAATTVVAEGVEIVTQQAGAIKVIGSSDDNIVNGNNAFNELRGMGGNDTLRGYDGNDILVGGEGNDILYGGYGSDSLYGEAGNDTLDGGSTENDYLSGGTGDDFYVVNGSDHVVESAGAGIDTVMSLNSSLILGANIENGELGSGGGVSLTGNELNNRLIGSANSNVINGGAGDDYLNGGAGNDVLIGGVGADTLDGSSGYDKYLYTTLSELQGGMDRIILGYGDKIDLSALDANLLSTTVNDSFRFIGTGAFTGIGQLAYNNGYLVGNVDANLGADFAIKIEGFNSISNVAESLIV